jgi:hypothetical protein
MATGCALDVDKNLKNASDIEFFNSETDSHPIRRHRTDVEPEQSGKTGACSFVCSNSTHHDNINMGLFFSGQRARRDVKGTKMAQYQGTHGQTLVENDQKNKIKKIMGKDKAMYSKYVGTKIMNFHHHLTEI